MQHAGSWAVSYTHLDVYKRQVHTSELSWTRIKDPSEVVSVGDVIDVYVKDFDPERKRVSLTYKTEAVSYTHL